MTSKNENLKKHFVLIYADGCSHCKPVVPIWKEIMDELKKKQGSKIEMSMIESNNFLTEGPKIHAGLKADGYPTFVKIDGGEIIIDSQPSGRDKESLLNWINGKTVENIDNKKKEIVNHRKSIFGSLFGGFIYKESRSRSRLNKRRSTRKNKVSSIKKSKSKTISRKISKIRSLSLSV